MEFPICKEVFRRHAFRLTVVDCGARPTDLEGKWRALGDRVFIHGFDADEAECERLNSRSPNARFYPLCLSSAVEEADLHITRVAHSSSLYPRAKAVTRWKSGLDAQTAFRTADYFDVVNLKRVRMTTRDAWADTLGVSDIDFIELDVPGAELDGRGNTVFPRSNCAGHQAGQKCLNLAVLAELYGHVEFAFELLAHLGLTEMYEKAARRYRLFRWRARQAHRARNPCR